MPEDKSRHAEERFTRGVKHSETSCSVPHCENFRSAALSQDERLQAIGRARQFQSPIEECIVLHFAVQSQRKHSGGAPRFRHKRSFVSDEAT
jgi:hypothetical protein